MNVQQNSVHMSLQAWEILEILVKMGNLAEENFFSLVKNTSLTLKMNICILELSMLFSKDLLFLYYIQVIGFYFSLRRIDLSQIFHCFILRWICP